MLATRGASFSGSPDNLFLYPKCEFDAISGSEYDAPPVIARTDPGRPAALLHGWNQNMWPISIELKDSEENGRVSRDVAHVVKSRTSLTTLCPISEPIATFTSTKQLVEAVRDAIKGHKVLAECGLLHQDISANSVFLTKSGQFKGFLHDLDYSVYARERGQDDGCQLSYGIPRTGTSQFIARDILDGDSRPPKDDLESFFWLLAWNAVRYVDYGWTMNSMSVVFDMPRDARSAKAYKIRWLEHIMSGEEIVTVKKDKPFMQLLDQLARLLLEPDVPDHARILRVFEDALDSQGWPEDLSCRRPNYYY